MSALSLRGIHVAYGTQTIVQNVTLPALERGTLTALVGPNGAGKSTLLRGLAGLESLRGEVTLDHQPLARLSHAERARRVTYLPQQLPPAMAFGVLESVVAAQRGGRRRSLPQRQALLGAYQALTRVGIEHLSDRRMDRLSGGQRQLVALAQLVARRPDVLLLDEPTSALDLRYQLQVMECVHALVREHALVGVVVLHDLNLAARYADRLVVLQQGRLVAEGPPDEALTPQLLADVYGVETRLERCSQGHLHVMADRATPAHRG